MSRSRFKPMFSGIVCLLLAICSVSSAQETPLFSGRVVDEAGEPVVDITVALMPVEDGNGAWFPVPVHENSHWAADPRAFSAVTDAEGNFSITDFSPGPVLLGLLPLYWVPADILRVEMSGFIRYAGGEHPERGIVLAMEPGERIEDVEVTVRRTLQIQGKVFRMDGKPLVNADIKLRLQLLNLDDGSKNSSGWSVQTNAEGEFVQRVSRWATKAPAYHIVSATYQEQRAKAKPVLLSPEALAFSPILKFTMPTLSGNARWQHGARASVSSEIEAQGVWIINRHKAHRLFRESPTIEAQGVWIINPGNGHAYKKIQCRSPEDAIFKASEEGAYLAAINDEAEQKWLERVFSPYPTLIGLSDIAKEGEWRWHSGEPVTYTNWARHEPHDTDRGEEDYVIWHHGWEDIGPEQVKWRFLRTALIEKEED